VQVGDVQALAPHVPIDAQSKPNAGQVSGWIADVEAELNAVLSQLGYVTPITGPVSLSILRRAVANAVMAMIMRSRPNPEIDPQQFQTRYDAMIKGLSDARNPLILIDAVSTNVEVRTSGAVRSNLADLEDDTPGTLTRDTVF
jgi:hypothetical protein